MSCDNADISFCGGESEVTMAGYFATGNVAVSVCDTKVRDGRTNDQQA